MVFEKMSAEDIGESVVLFVKCEHGTVGCACVSINPHILGEDTDSIRVSAASVHFFSPSPNRNNSNLREYQYTSPCLARLFTEEIVNLRS